MYNITKTKITNLLRTAGIAEVHTSKVTIPLELPAAVVALESITGEHQTSAGYKSYKYTAECFIAVENNEAADDTLLNILENIIQTAFMPSATIHSAEFYDSMIGSREVRIAKFDIQWTDELGVRN